jgi:NADH dehydrogenase/NADH:ubiquinone oxidoreductase subunit G
MRGVLGVYMINLKINGLGVSVEKGTTLLEAARFLGFPIPTLCHNDGLSPYGDCRVCTVEIMENSKSRLVTSCTYPATEGLQVRTASARVISARKMIIELLLASCPQSRKIQDLASAFGVRQQRFRQESENCILCGLCIRMCEEQMMAKAIGFRGRGERRSIGTPYDRKSDICRTCGACMYICPACQLRCTFNEPEKAICGACANLSAPCIEKKHFEDMMCYMSPCVACEINESAPQKGEKQNAIFKS